MHDNRLAVFLVAAALALLGVAVFVVLHTVLWRGESDQEAFRRERAAYRTPLHCTSCGYTFTRTSPELRQEMEAAGTESIGMPGSVGFKCPKCRSTLTYVGYYCGQCQRWYAARAGPSRAGGFDNTCPWCGGPPMPRPPKDDLPAAPPEEAAE